MYQEGWKLKVEMVFKIKKKKKPKVVEQICVMYLPRPYCLMLSVVIFYIEDFLF